jgi:hypothetical protein
MIPEISYFKWLIETSMIFPGVMAVWIMLLNVSMVALTKGLMCSTFTGDGIALLWA